MSSAISNIAAFADSAHNVQLTLVVSYFEESNKRTYDEGTPVIDSGTHTLLTILTKEINFPHLSCNISLLNSRSKIPL